MGIIDSLPEHLDMLLGLGKVIQYRDCHCNFHGANSKFHFCERMNERYIRQHSANIDFVLDLASSISGFSDLARRMGWRGGSDCLKVIDSLGSSREYFEYSFFLALQNLSGP